MQTHCTKITLYQTTYWAKYFSRLLHPQRFHWSVDRRCFYVQQNERFFIGVSIIEGESILPEWSLFPKSSHKNSNSKSCVSCILLTRPRIPLLPRKKFLDIHNLALFATLKFNLALSASFARSPDCEPRTLQEPYHHLWMFQKRRVLTTKFP